MRYLNPKADLPLNQVFAKHPDLVISLLNALLPLAPGEEIIDIEYLPVEIVQDNPLRKNSAVDVRCKNKQDQYFLVEIQMIWSAEFEERVMFTASKAYVRRIGIKENYHLLQPMYSLNLSNEIFKPELKGYYHHYKLVYIEDSDKAIDGLQLVFVELLKFNPHTYTGKRMQGLWLRYFTEINEKTIEVPEELLVNPEINKAVNNLRESAFTSALLLGYEKFWDIISVEKTLLYSAWTKGYKEGLEKERKKRIKQGIEKERTEEKQKIARTMKSLGLPPDVIAKSTGFSLEEIEQL